MQLLCPVLTVHVISQKPCIRFVFQTYTRQTWTAEMAMQVKASCLVGTFCFVCLICVCIAGIAQWLERRTHDRKVVGSNPCWSSGRIFFSRVSFLCWLLFRYPFHPSVTAVARKRPRSSCQKRRWQVTAKHAYTLRMWLCMKWHGAWLYGVHRTRRDWLSLWQQILVAPAMPAL